MNRNARVPLRSKPVSLILVSILIWLGTCPSASGSDRDIPYLSRMPYRIARGSVNIALGWTEIFLRPLGERENESPGESAALGGFHTLMRIAAGAMDITTFWVPDIRMTDIYPDWQGWPYLFHWS